MFGSVVIDVVIAMALVFTVFSLVTSGLRELVARLVSTRSKELWRSIRGLLEDPISNALRPSREAIQRKRDEYRRERAAAVSTAERRLRAARNATTEEAKWVEAVKSTTKRLREELTPRGLVLEIDSHDGTGAVERIDLGRLVDAAAAELEQAYRTDEGRLLARVSDFVKPMKSKRPTVPVVPTSGNVAALADSVRRGVRSLTDAVYDHPIVRQVDRTARGAPSAMDRLESGDFSEAVVDLIRIAGLEDEIRTAWQAAIRRIDVAHVELATEEMQERYAGWAHELTRRVSALPPTIQPLAAAAAIGDLVNEITDDAIEDLGDLQTADAEEFESLIDRHRRDLVAAMVRISNADPIELIEKGADALESVGEVREVVIEIAAKVRRAGDEVTDTLGKVAEDVGAWYDSRMNALSGWYRRRSRIVGFLLALVVVFAFNVDAVRLPRELWTNENVRSAVVAIADNAQVGLEECTALEGEPAAQCVEGKVDALVESGLPLGWVLSTSCDGHCGFWERIRYVSGMGPSAEDGYGEFFDVALKLLGWILAAAALSMGASFWFDVLRRAMGIRSAPKGEQAKT